MKLCYIGRLLQSTMRFNRDYFCGLFYYQEETGHVIGRYRRTTTTTPFFYFWNAVVGSDWVGCRS